MKTIFIKKICALLSLFVLISLLSSCIEVPVGPPGPPPGAVWVPGHYGPHGRWWPGHWA